MDRGTAHRCPGIKGHGFFFWFFILFVPLSMAALIGYWFYRRSGLARSLSCFPGAEPDRARVGTGTVRAWQRAGRSSGGRSMITSWVAGIEFEETMKTQAAPEAVHARA